VDQWDWEKVLTSEQRNKAYLHETVRLIYQALKNTEYIVCEHYPQIQPFLAQEIHFIKSEELLQRYPTLNAKQRENAICKELGAVFIEEIGARLSNGEKHDSRAADYDDWALNGDILIWYEPLQRAVELSSMGIRVDADSLRKQLRIAQNEDWEKRLYHSLVLKNELPLTIGGGIGQSRLCMVLLHKVHIGEIQVSIWPEKMIEDCKNENIPIL
jgi:aspartate--ammonia ligase